jgi:dATP pyrophosphohydrolase
MERAAPYKIPESVLVVIHTPEREVLLMERADRPGFWQSVTGSKDRPDEELFEVAVREVAEETGIRIGGALGDTSAGPEVAGPLGEPARSAAATGVPASACASTSAPASAPAFRCASGPEAASLSAPASAWVPRERLRDWGLVNVYEIYPVWRHRYAPDVFHNTEHVFGLTVPRETPVVLAPREHLRYEWLPWREAADRCFSPSNAEAILQLPRFA